MPAQKTTPAPPEKQEEWSRFQGLLIGRIGLCLIILLALAVADRVAGVTSGVIWVVLPVAIVIVLSAPYYLLARNRSASWLRAAVLPILVLDVALVTVGDYFLGGENSVYGLPIFAIYTAMAAAAMGWQGALLIGGAGIGLYATAILATSLGWIPEQPSAFPFRYSEAWPWMTVIVNTAGVTSIAIVTGVLAEVTRGARRRARALEEELRVLNRDLEVRVDGATEALQDANVSLAGKNMRLEQTLSRLNLFARAVSHDLRNPITAAGEALRLARDADADRHARLARLARQNLLRADEMLVGLRDLMRTVGSPPSRERVDVNALVDGLVAELAAAPGVGAVPVEAEGDLGELQAERNQLRHVFRNLIVNAWKHNRDVEALEIRVGREDREDEALFWIRDNGAGIPEEIQALIFEPFHRGPDQHEAGLGLGLALVETIVEQAGGKVWLESTVGAGATFRFTFPIRTPTG